VTVKPCALLLAMAISLGAEPKAPDFEALGKFYAKHGLPMPPPDAKFVRYSGGYAGWGMYQRPLTGYSVGWLIQPAGERQDAVLLDGIRRETVFWGDAQAVPLDAANLEEARKGALAWDAHAGGSLVQAIQLRARGQAALAEIVWKAGQEDLEANAKAAAAAGFEEPSGFDALAWLQSAAWGYWESSLTHPGTDREEVLKHLRLLLADVPELGGERRLARIRQLELTLVPNTARAGSPLALINALVEAGPSLVKTAFLSNVTELVAPLAELGYDAVPVLLTHTDDVRLTRRLCPAEMNREEYIFTVGDMVGTLLTELSCYEIEFGEVEAREWWDHAKSESEEEHYVRGFLKCPRGSWTNIPNLSVCRAVAKRFPKRLHGMYRSILETHPEKSSWDLSRIIALSELPREDKVNLLVEGTRHTDPEHWQGACKALKLVSETRCSECLLGKLGELEQAKPDDRAEALASSIANLALDLDQAEFWQAMDKVADRLAPRVRLRLISPYLDDEPEATRLHYLAFVRRFFEDETTLGCMPDGHDFAPGRGAWNLRVCDSLARKLSWSFGLRRTQFENNAPKEEWDAAIKNVLQHLDSRAAK
jgi:hypothetical protein